MVNFFPEVWLWFFIYTAIFCGLLHYKISYDSLENYSTLLYSKQYGNMYWLVSLWTLKKFWKTDNVKHLFNI